MQPSPMKISICKGTEAATCSCRAPLQYYARLLNNSKCLLLICAALITFFCISLVTVSSSRPFGHTLFGMLHLNYDPDEGNPVEYEHRIKQVFERASMPNRTVILTTLNQAWAQKGTMLNLFLESFWSGLETQRLLQHLIFICVDEMAYERCLGIHPHCIKIKTHGANLSKEQLLLSKKYIKLVWRRIKFLKTVLEMDFNFIFTDTDVLWFRDPFPLLQKNKGADIQIASDTYNERPWDIHNEPNSGFMYVQANKRTVNFFEYWYEQRKIDPNLATQGIFNIMKFDKNYQDIGVNLQFLDPKYFGGFCTIKHTDMTKSITMHATCCIGLEAKVSGLRKVLEGWKKWKEIHLLQKTYAKLIASENSFNNQTTLIPCNAQKLVISPDFDAPSACLQSIST